MIRGSLLLLFGSLILCVADRNSRRNLPRRVRGHNKISRFLRSCVVALAGTPSVIYGLFGLAVFVILLKLKVSLLARLVITRVFCATRHCSLRPSKPSKPFRRHFSKQDSRSASRNGKRSAAWFFLPLCLES
jgi:ABC-type phosphate transport system permease subunit